MSCFELDELFIIFALLEFYIVFEINGFCKKTCRLVAVSYKSLSLKRIHSLLSLAFEICIIF